MVAIKNGRSQKSRSARLGCRIVAELCGIGGRGGAKQAEQGSDIGLIGRFIKGDPDGAGVDRA